MLSFFPNMGTMQFDNVLEQGMFISENEMSKIQAVQDYLNDAIQNEKEFNSPIFLTGIFSYEQNAPIKNWLMNSIENLKGNTIELPNDWLQILDISVTKEFFISNGKN